MGFLGFAALFGILGWVALQVVLGIPGLIWFIWDLLPHPKAEHKEQVDRTERAFRYYEGMLVRWDTRYGQYIDRRYEQFVIVGMNEDHTRLVTSEGEEVYNPDDLWPIRRAYNPTKVD